MRTGSRLPYTILASISFHILLGLGMALSSSFETEKMKAFEVEILPGTQKSGVATVSGAKPENIKTLVSRAKRPVATKSVADRAPASVEDATPASLPTEDSTGTSTSSLPTGVESLRQGSGITGLVMEAPNYPERCKRERIEGITEIAVEFRDDGSVAKTELKKSSEACPEFSAVSLKAAANARFIKSPETHLLKFATLPFRFRLNR